MALTDAQIARLALLEAARDRLLSGGVVAKVSSGGRTVEYAPADLGTLRAEIRELQALQSDRVRGPVRFRFR